MRMNPRTVLFMRMDIPAGVRCTLLRIHPGDNLSNKGISIMAKVNEKIGIIGPGGLRRVTNDGYYSGSVTWRLEGGEEYTLAFAGAKFSFENFSHNEEDIEC